MTNWKKVKITEKDQNLGCIQFMLDDHVYIGKQKFSSMDGYFPLKSTFIMVEGCRPFNTWQVGDYIEVDLDKSVNCSPDVAINDISIVRKVSSSAVVSSSSGGLTIPTTPSSAAEVARTVTQTVLDHADRTGGIPQIEVGTDKTSIWYHPPKK